MPDELSPEARAQLRGIVKKLSVSHDIDPEIQEELYGHVEDKALAYLSGEEAVSEDDALLLTREHFGDPRSVREFLSAVHMQEATGSTMRRIAAITILSLAMMIPIRLLYLLTAIMPAWYTTHFGGVAETALAAVYLAALVFVLHHWDGQAESVWFLRWRPRSLALAVCVLGLLLVLVPVVGTSVAPQSPIWVLRITMMAAVGIALLQVLVWLRWTDQKPRRMWAVFQGVCAWFLFMFFINVIQSTVTPKIVIDASGNKEMTFDLLRGDVVGFAGSMGAIGLGFIVQAAAALAVYAMAAGAVWAWGRWRRGVEMA